MYKINKSNKNIIYLKLAIKMYSLIKSRINQIN